MQAREAKAFQDACEVERRELTDDELNEVSGCIMWVHLEFVPPAPETSPGGLVHESRYAR